MVVKFSKHIQIEDSLWKSARSRARALNAAKGDAKRLISSMFRPITPQENGHGSPVTPATNVATQSNGRHDELAAPLLLAEGEGRVGRHLLQKQKVTSCKLQVASDK